MNTVKSTWPKLKQEFEDRGIIQCEVCRAFPDLFPDCNPGWLTPAHKSKRAEYRIRPETLWTYPEVVIACITAHQKMEQDKELTKKIFAKLRPQNRLF